MKDFGITPDCLQLLQTIAMWLTVVVVAWVGYQQNKINRTLVNLQKDVSISLDFIGDGLCLVNRGKANLRLWAIHYPDGSCRNWEFSSTEPGSVLLTPNAPKNIYESTYWRQKFSEQIKAGGKIGLPMKLEISDVDGNYYKVKGHAEVTFEDNSTDIKEVDTWVGEIIPTKEKPEGCVWKE